MEEREPIASLLLELQPLIGLPCPLASVAYGNSLTLHFGTLLTFKDPPLKGHSHGTWQVFSDAGGWRVVSHSRIVGGDCDDELELGVAVDRVSGETLVAIEALGVDADVRFVFSNSMRVELIGGSTARPTWEVVGPAFAGRVGPGPFWARSDSLTEQLNQAENIRSAHAEECADRWAHTIPPSHSSGPCNSCAYYLPLRGEFYFWDFGLCSNASSEHDGIVVGIRSGCLQHSDQLGRLTEQ